MSIASDPSVPELPATLRQIVEHKRREVEASKGTEPIADLRDRVAHAPPTRDFIGSLTRHLSPERTHIIAEIKRASPSAGLIRPQYGGDAFRPEPIAAQYAQAGASAISCLTDEKFFGGHLSYINAIKAHTDLPVLRKDFIIDPYQITQSRAHGADAVLLIAECLSDEQITSMLAQAHELGLAVLLEVHSRENLLRAQPIMGRSPHRKTLLGINNRDLTRMVTDLAHSTDLAHLVDDPTTLVSESGIRSPDDLARLRAHGIHIALVGEHLMRQPHPGDALRQLLLPPTPSSPPSPPAHPQ